MVEKIIYEKRFPIVDNSNVVANIILMNTHSGVSSLLALEMPTIISFADSLVATAKHL